MRSGMYKAEGGCCFLMSHFLLQGQRSRTERKSDKETHTASHIYQTVKFLLRFGNHRKTRKNTEIYLDLDHTLKVELREVDVSGQAVLQQHFAPCHVPR